MVWTKEVIFQIFYSYGTKKTKIRRYTENMAQILCDCGCGKTVERPVFFSAACKMRYRRGTKMLPKSNHMLPLSNEKSSQRVTNVTKNPDYEYADNGFGRQIRRLGPGYDWEIQNPTTLKWVPFEG